MIICKICGSRISDEVACCARCFTPHHFDCWSFAGQCSIFACGCKEHRYFDFREQDEAAVLAAISKSLALAIRQEPTPVVVDKAAGPEKSRDAAAAADLILYKRGLFRNLSAVLAKVAPDRAVASEELAGSLEAELGEAEVPALFLADDLSIEEEPRPKDDMKEKARLLRSLASQSAPEEGGGLGEWLRKLLRWFSGKR